MNLIVKASMLIVSVKTLDMDKLALAQAVGEGIEIRIDAIPHMSLFQLAKARKNIHKPLIFTLRKSSQGGFFKYDERTWYENIKSLCTLHPDFFDVDYDISPRYFDMLKERFPHINWIVSYHETDARIDLPSLFNLLPKANIYKIVTYAKSSIDSLKMLEFVKEATESGKKIVGLCMGEKGAITRILANVYGSYFNYCALHEDEKTAEGQLSAFELLQTYHTKKNNRETKVFALIGNPVEQSPSHLTHNHIFFEHSINAIYVKIPLEKEDLGSFFYCAKKLQFKGLSVTMPLKEAVIPFLDATDEAAKASHACNTILFEGNAALGFNTDGIGALEAVEKRLSLANKKALIIGAGGAAKAICYTLKNAGAHVFIYNRTKEKAEIAAKNLELDVFDSKEKLDFELIINCTPSQMPIDEEVLSPHSVVLDIVHTRATSMLLIKAEQKGCQIIHGMEMFKNQALHQFEKWLKEKLPVNNLSFPS